MHDKRQQRTSVLKHFKRFSAESPTKNNLSLWLLWFAFPLAGRMEKRSMKLLPALRCGINGEFMPGLFLCSQSFRAAKVSAEEQGSSCCEWIMVLVETESSYKHVFRAVHLSPRLLHSY